MSTFSYYTHCMKEKIEKENSQEKKNKSNSFIHNRKNRIFSVLWKNNDRNKKLKEIMDNIDSFEESPKDDSKEVEEYKSTCMDLFSRIDFNDKNKHLDKLKDFYDKLQKILSNKSREQITLNDIRWIILLMKLARKPAIPEKDIKSFTFSKFANYPDIIKWENVFNCVGATMLFCSILKSLWIECYPVSCDGHMVSLIKIEGEYYLVDSLNFSTPLYKKEKNWKWIRKIDKKNTKIFKLPWDKKFWVIKLKDKFWQRKWWYINATLNETIENSCHENDELLVSMYEWIQRWQLEQKLQWYNLDVDAIKDLWKKYKIYEKFKEKNYTLPFTLDRKVF